MVSEIRENSRMQNVQPVLPMGAGVPVNPGSVDRQYNELLSLAQTVAGSKASVLILGEIGTGKRTLARFIHEKSTRSVKPYFMMNCRETAVGDQDSVFTGLANQAVGSTLILAEIWKLSVPVQLKLFDLIQKGSDIRIVATSSRSLSGLVRNGDFKEELFYRLNVVNLKVPNLQERLGDIEVLAKSMVSRFALSQGRADVTLSEEAVLLLNSHRWAGNIRELESVCERAVLLAQGSEIRAKDIQFQGQLESSPRVEGSTLIWKPGRTLDEIERTVILEALKHFSGNRTHTAKALGISIRTLRNKLAEFRVMGIKA
jgi:two-component system response regulator FlrC